MFLRQTLMVLNTIMKNPGLDCLQLGAKIEEKYGKENDAVKFMFLEEMDKNSHFRTLIKEIYCVEEKDGHFYYNEELPLPNESDFHQLSIHCYLEDFKEKKYKKEREQHGENIVH